ncbi:MAG: hypothetical protein AAGG01_23375 [Planctomycetota bacterium]
MAKILIMTSGLTGILNASLEVVRRLEEAQHDVTYACPHDVRETVERHGVEYVQLPPISRSPSPERTRRDGESRVAHKWAEWRTRRERRDQGVEALRTGAVETLLAELRPDLVLLDFDLEEHVITCHAARVRIAILSQWFEFRRRPGLPPLGSNLERGSAAQRWLAWTGSRARSRARQSATYLRYFGTDRRGVVREHARRSGFPAAGLWSHDWSTLFAFEGIPVLSMTMEELDFPHRRGSRWSYVGPMVRLERDDGARADEPRRRIAEFTANARRGGQRVVYASVSSMGTARDADFVTALAHSAARRAAKGGESSWSLILGLGGHASVQIESALDATLDQRAREQVLVLAFAPQLDALREADLFITHGGIHSIHESIALGVPMAAYSGAAFDQDGCVARLAFHDAASVGSRTDSAEAIAQRLDSALDDEHLRARTTELQRALARYQPSLADSIDELLAEPVAS